MAAATGVLLCDDLIFASRIDGAATAAGFAMRIVKTAELLLESAGQTGVRCVIIDLNTRDLDIAQTLEALKRLSPSPFVVGYGSHVDVVTLNKARNAGCNIVWPRSKFTQELESALPGWFGAEQ